jgi:hypothetical protein
LQAPRLQGHSSQGSLLQQGQQQQQRQQAPPQTPTTILGRDMWLSLLEAARKGAANSSSSFSSSSSSSARMRSSSGSGGLPPLPTGTSLHPSASAPALAALASAAADGGGGGGNAGSSAAAFSFPQTPSPSPPRTRRQPLRAFGLKPGVPSPSPQGAAASSCPSSNTSSSRSLTGDGAGGLPSESGESGVSDGAAEGDNDDTVAINLKAAAAAAAFAASPYSPPRAPAVALPASPFKAAASASFTASFAQQQQQQQKEQQSRAPALLRRNACLAGAALCLALAHARLLSSLAAAVAADPRPFLGTLAAVALVIFSGALDDLKRGLWLAGRLSLDRLRALSRSPAAAAPLSVARRLVAIIDGLGLLPVLLARLETELACVRADIYSIRLKADWLPDRKRKAAQHDPADAALPPMSAPAHNVSVQTLARRAERAAANGSSSGGGGGGGGGLGSALAAAAAASAARRAFSAANAAAAAAETDEE